jgi:protocatechuate 3,4-dioxygenase beta subunit
MFDSGTISRRGFTGLLAGLLAAVLRPVRAVAAWCRGTVTADDGPFYPVEEIPLADDLTRVPGVTGRARGPVLYLTGRVLDPECRPLGAATVEIWQCDREGHYRHPRSEGQERLDPAFRYFGKVWTDPEGRFRFRTIQPASYTAFGIERAPHIHVKVRAGERPALVSEVYFAGVRDDRLRERDRVYLSRGPRRADLIASVVTARSLPELDDVESGASGCRVELRFPEA